MEVNHHWVNVLGKKSNPRYVWVVDRVARQVVFDINSFGFGEEDQILHFASGTFRNILSYLEERKADYGGVTAFVFVFVGMDDLAVDVPAAQDDPEIRFHPLGPRQQASDVDVTEVVRRYERLVEESLRLFPSASIFSTNPAPRRSSGFAVARAAHVTKEVKQQGARHHHFSLMRKFHGKLYGAAKDRPGGRLPIHEEYFEPNGIELTKGAFTGVVVKAKMVLDAVLGTAGCILTDANKIHDVKMFY